MEVGDNVELVIVDEEDLENGYKKGLKGEVVEILNEYNLTRVRFEYGVLNEKNYYFLSGQLKLVE